MQGDTFHKNMFLFSLTWLLAEAFCKKKDDTSSIASLQSKEENEFVRKLTNITIWLGLEGRGVFRGNISILESFIFIFFSKWMEHLSTLSSQELSNLDLRVPILLFR